ncbi:LysM peptidoglycan-binding domain-containing protein [Peribacillus alkalitolerans]|uniref:LysM peptidoglycan-binding domain-containing protein n=1 Tax=Peribacillus alkalitolerans TaxID=1550385 RepID=UPI0013D64505|nr:LysM peptidoglycan-binding domain-containing protein [Peribacillus alkalitolerans]
MTKSIFRIFSILILIAAFAIPSLASAQADVVSFNLSSNTVAYQGNTVPGFVTIDLKTSVPTRGHLMAIGNGRQGKIILSSTDFKTDHKVDWVPWDEVKKEALPPGEYQIKAYLQDKSLDQMVGYPLGKLTVVSESNPKAVIDGVTVTPDIFSPKYGTTNNAQIKFNLNRPAEVQLSIQKNGDEIFAGQKMKLAAGSQIINWNGTDKSGRIVADGTYDVVFKYIETAYSYPSTTQSWIKPGTITVKDGDYYIPVSRLKEIVTSASYKSSSITPNERVTGEFTLAKAAKVTVYITNAAGAHVKNVIPEQTIQPGVHTFQWDGTDMMGGKVPNGSYSIKLGIIEGGNFGYITFPDASVRVEGSTKIEPMQPVKNVRVISEKATMSIEPMGQGYTAIKGDIFPLLSETVENGKYQVLVKEGVAGTINVSDVEPVTVIPTTPDTTEYTVVSGDTLWKIATKFNTTVSEIVTLNQLDPNKPLLVGQKLKVPTVKPTEPTPPTGQTIHVVQAGDVLWKIAQKYNVTTQAIIDANKIDPSNLQVGQKLVIPTATPTPQPTQPMTYTVVSGDTLWKIAQKFGTTIDAIATLNQLDSAKPLLVGQTIKIPEKVQVEQPVIHTVQSGDTLWKIAQKYGTSVDAIVKANNLDPAKYLEVGQKLTIVK